METVPKRAYRFIGPVQWNHSNVVTLTAEERTSEQRATLSWKERAEAFRTSRDKVFDGVEHVVSWEIGAPHGRPDRSHCVDEIQYAKGHKYPTLVYQIDIGIPLLLWLEVVLTGE